MVTFQILLKLPSALINELKDPAADTMRSSSELNWKKYDLKKRLGLGKEKEEEEDFDGEWERGAEDEDELERRVSAFFAESHHGEADLAKSLKLLKEV